MKILGVLSIMAAAVAAVLLAIPTPDAHADTGACVSYLEDIGQDTTARVQVCAETETVADTVSQAAAFTVCGPLMTATLLPQPFADKACQLAVAP